MIPVAGVGTVGIVVTTPSRLVRIYCLATGLNTGSGPTYPQFLSNFVMKTIIILIYSIPLKYKKINSQKLK